jgi:hypothetical protein
LTSILTDVKKTLGLAADYTAFDLDVTLHINTALSTLTQLGIGPDEGFMITDASDDWEDFIGDDARLNSVKTYVYLRVRLLFDPPASYHFLTSYKEQIAELEWRLNVTRENDDWVDPNPAPPPSPPEGVSGFGYLIY